MTTGSQTRRIVVAGASGLIGRHVCDDLLTRGYDVHTLVRRAPEHDHEHRWDPERAEIDPEVLRGSTALISLGGASVGRLPWTKRYRKALWNSRIHSTRTLATAINTLGDDAPEMWLSASAVGYYGHRPGEALTEGSTPGDTFLATLCVAWEAEALAAGEHTRVTLLRTAPVVHPEGVLKPMILLTKFGLAGPLGRGTQHWPWISLVDEVRAIRHIIEQQLVGPVNLTGPTMQTANDVGRALATHLRRPFIIPAPAFALHLALGKDATESLLTSDARVTPDVLLASGFTFTHTHPSEAIREAL